MSHTIGRFEIGFKDRLVRAYLFNDALGFIADIAGKVEVGLLCMRSMMISVGRCLFRAFIVA